MVLGDAGELVGVHGSLDASLPHHQSSGKSGMSEVMVEPARPDQIWKWEWVGRGVAASKVV